MKAWTIAWKDTLVRFRDRNAIILMIVAPIALSAIMGAAFGGGGNETVIQDIPLIIVNEDQGIWGESFVSVFTSEALSELLDTERMDSLPEALTMVESGETSAVIYLPPDFSELLRVATGEEDLPAQIQLVTDPALRVRPLIIETIATQVAISLANSAVAEAVTFNQLAARDEAAIDPETIGAIIGAAMTDTLANAEEGAALNLIPIESNNANSLNPVAFFVPSMAIFFLMFTTFDGTRSILVEHRDGTFTRLRSTPTQVGEILLGKVTGTVLMGFLQFIILVIASNLLFGLNWGGSILALVLVSVSYIVAATSLGMLVTALAKDVAQAGAVGGVITLLFGVLGGNFLSVGNFPEWLQWLSYLAINRWGLEGLSDLTLRGLLLPAVLPEVAIMTGVAIIFFGIALWQLPRRLT